MFDLFFNPEKFFHMGPVTIEQLSESSLVGVSQY